MSNSIKIPNNSKPRVIGSGFSAAEKIATFRLSFQPAYANIKITVKAIPERIGWKKKTSIATIKQPDS